MRVWVRETKTNSTPRQKKQRCGSETWRRREKARPQQTSRRELRAMDVGNAREESRRQQKRLRCPGSFSESTSLAACCFSGPSSSATLALTPPRICPFLHLNRHRCTFRSGSSDALSPHPPPRRARGLSPALPPLISDEWQRGCRVSSKERQKRSPQRETKRRKKEGSRSAGKKEGSRSKNQERTLARGPSATARRRTRRQRSKPRGQHGTQTRKGVGKQRRHVRDQRSHASVVWRDALFAFYGLCEPSLMRVLKITEAEGREARRRSRDRGSHCQPQPPQLLSYWFFFWQRTFPLLFQYF